MREAIRQGDILLVPVDEKPEGMVNIRRKPNEGIIVAEGEATGHHHRIRTRGARMYRRGRTRFITVPKGGAVLEHEEHAPLTIEPGVHRVVHQREYAEKAPPQRVWD